LKTSRLRTPRLEKLDEVCRRECAKNDYRHRISLALIEKFAAKHHRLSRIQVVQVVTDFVAQMDTSKPLTEGFCQEVDREFKRLGTDLTSARQPVEVAAMAGGMPGLSLGDGELTPQDFDGTSQCDPAVVQQVEAMDEWELLAMYNKLQMDQTEAVRTILDSKQKVELARYLAEQEEVRLQQEAATKADMNAYFNQQEAELAMYHRDEAAAGMKRRQLARWEGDQRQKQINFKNATEQRASDQKAAEDARDIDRAISSLAAEKQFFARQKTTNLAHEKRVQVRGSDVVTHHITVTALTTSQ
jgi:hypothetical protein